MLVWKKALQKDAEEPSGILYAHEIKLMVYYKSGESPLNYSKVSCLLPKPFRRLYFLNRQDFIANIEDLNINEKLTSMNIDDLLIYGNIGFIILLSDFYSNALFNECYTDIINIHKPIDIRKRFASEIFQYVNALCSKFNPFEHQLKGVFNYAFDMNSEKSSELEDKIFYSRLFNNFFFLIKL